MSRRKRWKYSAGERPNTVTVYEREPGGVLYARVGDPTKRGGEGNWVRRSLGHRDQERAKDYALDQAAKLRKGQDDLSQGKITLGQIFALYQRHRTPRKTPGEQQADERRVELWTRVLGAGKDPHLVSLGEWERFIDQRSSGAIDARGATVEKVEDRRPVRDRTVEADCNWLGWVFNWASTWRTPGGHYLMRENPVRGYDAPKEENPRQPVATQDRFEAIRAVSDDVTMEVRWRRKWETRRSYLSELLDIVNGTGRRITAVCRLAYGDLLLSEGPHGAIRWRAENDKMGREMVVVIPRSVRAALDRIIRDRPGIGAAPIFPSPEDPSVPIRYELASAWLRKAEKLAGVEPQKGSLWHAYRRRWVTDRKELPDVDVARMGGWKSVKTMQASYQHADEETSFTVVMWDELREAR